MQQACRALAYAHKNGVVHRDIKLSNMMLTERGGERDVLVLVDFGLIKVVTDQIAERQSQEVPDEAPSGDHPGLTQANTVVGSPLFMSPEQIRGLRVDHRSDIYSLGCVMYNCLTGRVPFEGSETHQTFYKHIYENPAPFSQINPQNKVPEALEAVVMRALAKDPDERYQDVQQLADDISRALKRRRLIDEVDASNLSNESSLLNSKRITQLHSESTVRLLSIALVVVVLGLGFLYYKFAQQLDRQDRPAPATQTHSPEALPASKSREQ
jgi:serine/threonine protein kinase